MKRLWHLLLAAALLSALARPGGAEKRPLNLLLITADDMNADSSGWMGSKLGATPNLDAFAGTCHRFLNHHVTAPICQPSREALMTGRVPHRSGGLGFNPILPGIPTLPSVLKERGYFTGVVEKHVHMKPDASFPWDVKLGGSGKNPPLFRRHVEELLRASVAAGKPFFINANITDPHRPFPGAPGRRVTRPGSGFRAQGSEGEEEPAGGGPMAPARVYRSEEVPVPSFLEDLPPVRQEVAQYYTAVARFDATFGGILAALKEAKHEEDTVVAFLSDHGMSFPFSKATVYRNGTWSPVLLRWPGMGRPAAREEWVSSVDLMPTLLELLDVPRPNGMDGRSWLPLLRGERQPGRDHVFTHVNTVSSGKSFPQRCVRTRDAALMFHAWPDGTPHFRVEAMSGLTFRALAEAGKQDARIGARVDQLLTGTALALYDERADPDERKNRVQDPARRPEVERLAGLLLAHMERTGDPQIGAFREALSSSGFRVSSSPTRGSKGN